MADEAQAPEREPENERATPTTKSLGIAIDELINTLSALKTESRLTAVKAACEHLGIEVGHTVEPSDAQGDADWDVPRVTESGTQRRITDIRSLKQATDE